MTNTSKLQHHNTLKIEILQCFKIRQEHLVSFTQKTKVNITIRSPFVYKLNKSNNQPDVYSYTDLLNYKIFGETRLFFSDKFREYYFFKHNQHMVRFV